jgi:hypothetical protein
VEGETYADARELAVRLSSQGSHRDKAFRIIDPQGNTVAVAVNGEVTNADGTGPNIDPEAIVGAVRLAGSMFQSVYTRRDRKIRVDQLPAPPGRKASAPVATGVWNDDGEFLWTTTVIDPGIVDAATAWLRVRLNSEGLAKQAIDALHQRGVSASVRGVAKKTGEPNLLAWLFGRTWERACKSAAFQSPNGGSGSNVSERRDQKSRSWSALLREAATSRTARS